MNRYSAIIGIWLGAGISVACAALAVGMGSLLLGFTAFGFATLATLIVSNPTRSDTPAESTEEKTLKDKEDKKILKKIDYTAIDWLCSCISWITGGCFLYIGMSYLLGLNTLCQDYININQDKDPFAIFVITVLGGILLIAFPFLDMLHRSRRWTDNKHRQR